MKYKAFADKTISRESRPARGGWIEITGLASWPTTRRVPPRKGRVD